MNHIKMNGSVDSSEIIDIVSKFKDINNAETIQQMPEREYSKYMRYGLDAVKETIGRHRDGRFENLQFSSGIESIIRSP